MSNHRNIKLLFLVLIVVGACFCFVQSGHASADPFLDGKIKVQYDRIASWAHDGHVVGCLVFSAFLIGLLVTTLHLVPLWWMKLLTVVLSFIGAVIIGYYHQFFPADDRAYDKAVRDARGLLDDFSIQLEGDPSLDTATRTAL